MQINTLKNDQQQMGDSHTKGEDHMPNKIQWESHMTWN